MKRIVLSLFQPVTLAVTLLFWTIAPSSLIGKPWWITVVSISMLMMVQALEFVSERHAGWRLDRREFLTDLFYTALFYSVIAWAVTKLSDEPLVSAKHVLGITTDWAMHLPFLAQVALTIFLIEFGQYWMHRAMHNSFLWWIHAPHHHITQFNALKGAVGNPLELFLVSISVVALFDLQKNAVFCALSILGVVGACVHANVRFYTPRWYSYIFNTVEAHSLHHSVRYEDTRCNYANNLILIDRLYGTFREGDSAVVGQDERKRLSIKEQFIFPLRPLLAMIKMRSGKSAPAAG